MILNDPESNRCLARQPYSCGAHTRSGVCDVHVSWFAEAVLLTLSSSSQVQNKRFAQATRHLESLQTALKGCRDHANAAEKAAISQHEFVPNLAYGQMAVKYKCHGQELFGRHQT